MPGGNLHVLLATNIFLRDTEEVDILVKHLTTAQFVAKILWAHGKGLGLVAPDDLNFVIHEPPTANKYATYLDVIHDLVAQTCTESAFMNIQDSEEVKIELTSFNGAHVENRKVCVKSKYPVCYYVNYREFFQILENYFADPLLELEELGSHEMSV